MGKLAYLGLSLLHYPVDFPEGRDILDRQLFRLAEEQGRDIDGSAFALIKAEGDWACTPGGYWQVNVWPVLEQRKPHDGRRNRVSWEQTGVWTVYINDGDDRSLRQRFDSKEEAYQSVRDLAELAPLDPEGMQAFGYRFD